MLNRLIILNNETRFVYLFFEMATRRKNENAIIEKMNYCKCITNSLEKYRSLDISIVQALFDLHV